MMLLSVKVTRNLTHSVLAFPAFHTYSYVVIDSTGQSTAASHIDHVSQTQPRKTCT